VTLQAEENAPAAADSLGVRLLDQVAPCDCPQAGRVVTQARAARPWVAHLWVGVFSR
jgi:hypothetical protein